MTTEDKSKTPKKWAAPRAPKKGDDDERDTYAAVGLALSKWEQLEHQLGEIFLALIGYGRNVEAHRAYASIMANSGRLDMINAAQEVFFLYRQSDEHQTIRKNLANLLSDVRALAGRRNEIAHGIVGIKPGDDWENFTDASYVLAPSYFSQKKRTLTVFGASPNFGMLPDYEYGSAQIKAIAGWFASVKQPATRIALAIRRQRHLERQASPENST